MQLSDEQELPESASCSEAYGQALVARWDRLIGWAERTRSEGSFFIDLLRESGVHRVLDAATGTGFHAVSLAAAGFSVTAVDRAPAMVEQARRNLAEHGLDTVRCVMAEWRNLPAVVPGPFDAVICLGNSISHVFTVADLAAALTSFKTVLRPGGRLILDQRNYDSLLDGTMTRTRRSYCCVGGGASVSVDLTGPGIASITYTIGEEGTYRIHTCPWRRRDLVEALTAAGFDVLATYGDYQQCFDPAAVEFLIHVAVRR